MNATNGSRFYADVQTFAVTETVTLYCFQPPCGGSLFVIRAPDETVMIDTGYGIYHDAVMAMLSRSGIDLKNLSRIIVTHADADHCGGAGFFTVPVWMHEGTRDIIRTNNRAYGSTSDHSSLDEFYTRMINLFSKFNTPADIRCFSRDETAMRGTFAVIGRFSIGDVAFEVLDGLGGHTYGQVFLYSEECGLLFTADSVINFASMTKDRADYSSLAAFLVTSVNVDSGRATQERRALLALAEETDAALAGTGRRCLICCGHGAVSVLANGKLAVAGTIGQYRP
jgi:glyoxylase-like metal-dependent hydrolase (beta-lactamase superfamily II)